jgi:hypothetical protein
MLQKPADLSKRREWVTEEIVNTDKDIIVFGSNVFDKLYCSPFFASNCENETVHSQLKQWDLFTTDIVINFKMILFFKKDLHP